MERDEILARLLELRACGDGLRALETLPAAEVEALAAMLASGDVRGYLDRATSAGVGAYAGWPVGRLFPLPDPRFADLSGANLRGAYLRGADLSYADLSGANLRGANLSRANLSRADLRGADLSYADLSGADLRCADLSRADLRGANLSRANLSGADLNDANLRHADLRWARFEAPDGTTYTIAEVTHGD